MNKFFQNELQPNESLYEQKPEELVVPVSTSTKESPTGGSSFPSRFEYVDDVQPLDMNSTSPQVINHVAPPKSSSFFSDFGMDSGFQKSKSFSSSKVQVGYAVMTLLLLNASTQPGCFNCVIMVSNT